MRGRRWALHCFTARARATVRTSFLPSLENPCMPGIMVKLFAIPTTPEARMDNLILAIDLGKFNSLFCWFEPASGRTAFRSVRSAPAEFRRLLTRRPVGRVVVEAGATCGWVADLCGEL